MTRYRHPLDAFVGFDRLFNEMDTFQQTTKPFPPHNLLKLDLDGSEYAIELAVAGYKEEDISIEVKDGILTVEGTGSVDEYTYLHKGISNKNFKREFRLSENMVVDSASCCCGILTIEMHEEIPEEKKPRKIELGKKKKKTFLRGA